MYKVPTRPCPACGSCHVRGEWSLRDRLFRAVAGSFTYFECGACRSLYIDPIPTPGEVPAFYPSGYWCEAPQGTDAWINPLAAAYRRWVVRDHLRFLKDLAIGGSARRKLLDAGCGSGTFLLAARKQGFEVTGLDFSEKALSELQAHGIDAAVGTLSENNLGECRFDVITLFHVLEHLADPLKDLQALLRHLVSGGSLIAQVPDRSSLQARIFCHRWYGLDPPRHMTQFTSQGVICLLERAGLRTRSTFSFSLRDNAPAIASSLCPSLDPKVRWVRNCCNNQRANPWVEGLFLGMYSSLVLLAMPLALLEASIGAGGTRIVHASKS